MDNGHNLKLSAAELDAALARAQNISNPNLLDNWYFGNPVDQRGGYVVPPGTGYYIPGTGTQIGTTSVYYPVLRIIDGQYPVINIDGTEYVTPPNTAVRGYTGVGYGIDRWYTRWSGTTVIRDGCLDIESDSTMDQMREHPFEEGNYTFSILYKDGVLDTAVLTFAGEQVGVWLPYGRTNISISSTVARIYTTGNKNQIVAVKLELGSQQTLAHQGENGNWVLNEIPNYNEELLKCIQSTADGSDTYANKVVATRDYALPRDGSAAMTGALRIFENRGVVNTEYGESVTTTYLRSIFGDRTYSLEVGNFGPRYFEGVVNNPWSNERLILHTGNKPSGSYTGNGSSTERTIATGGIGKCCMVYGGTGEVAYLVPIGAFFQTNGVATFTSDVWFDNGVIYLRNAYIINMNGTTYNYQVL